MSVNWNAFRYKDGIFGEFGIIVTCLIFIVGVWLFIEITGEVTDGDTRSFDEYVLSSLRQSADLTKPIGPEWGEEVARDITALGSKTLLTLLVLSVAGFLLLKKHYGQAGLIVSVSVAGVLLMSGLKLYFMRERPDIIPHLASAVNKSYPSGHTLMSAVVYLSLASMLSYFQKSRALKIYTITVVIMITFLVGTSRVYLGVHYPTDVLAGWALGFALASFCWILFRYFNYKLINEGKL